MRSFRDQGMVLRHHNLGEADRIIVLFTRNHGVVRCVAKGVRRTQSRFGARLEPFTISDVVLYSGKNLHTVTEALTVHTYNAAIVEDYGRYTAATAVLEATERLLGEEGFPQPTLFDLTAGVVAAIAQGQRRPQQLLDAFLLRATAAAGWTPQLEVCAVCGEPGRHHAFHPAAGGVVCSTHCPPRSMLLLPGTVEYVQALRDAQWDRVDQISADRQLGERIQQQGHQLMVAHLQWHTERKITSLQVADEAERNRS